MSTAYRMALAGAALACLLTPTRAAAAPWDSVPPLGSPLVLDAGIREVDYLASWTATAVVPAYGAEQTPVLAFRARVNTPTGGGCNYVLRVFVNGRPVTDTPFTQRLLNKPLAFDPLGTQYHFQWYGQDRWMMVFTPSFDDNWGGSGHDCEFLFDLTGFAAPGERATVTFTNAAVCDIAQALGLPRTPMVVERPTLGLLAKADVRVLRLRALGAEEMRAAPARAELPADAKAGPRAYEVVWSGRPAPPSQVAFDDLRGWTLRVHGDAEVAVEASVEQLLWRPRVARLSYSGGTRPTTAELAPPQPISIPGPFDSVNLWLYGGLDRGQDQSVQIAAVMEDAGGAEFAVDLGPVTSTYWGLQHGVVDGRLVRPRFPARLKALLLANLNVKGSRRLYLESMLFYEGKRRPARRYDRPAPPAFPTLDDGLLPPAPAGVTVTARRVGRGAGFASRSPGGTLAFTVAPEKGALEGMTARWQAGPSLRLMKGGGVVVEAASGAGAVPADAVLLASGFDGRRLQARWRSPSTGAEWSAAYWVRGRTLVADVRCEGGRASGLRLGRVAGLPDPKGIAVPYLWYNGAPWVACGGGLFISVLPDLYHSDFTAPDPTTSPPTTDGIGLFHGTTYAALTDGRRNPLRDRVLVTVSPEFGDVLPGIPNPPSPNRQRLAPCMFFMADTLNPNLYRVWRRYGLEHVIANDFAALFVADYAEGFSMRWRPHPSLTTEEARAYAQGIRDLGYTFGAYADFTDYFPLNEFWDENKVALTADGDLADAWYGNLATKVTAMPGLVREVGSRCRDLYRPGCVYLDTHTVYGPVARDLEAGAAGAGIGRTTVVANGDAILEARRQYGSTISEGIHRWLYAGLTDMDYATLPAVNGSANQPLLVDFDLLRIHPLEIGTMMGYAPGAYFPEADVVPFYADPGRGLGPPLFYRYVATSLAYGHGLILGYGYVPPLARIIHYYALMQAAQREYLTDTVAEVSYHDGERFFPTSQALAAGANLKGRVRVRYSRGLVAQANCNPTESWRVEWDGRAYDLPPWGWVIGKPGELLAFSATVDGARRDYVRAADYVYLNAGDGTAGEGAVAASGAVWLKRDGSGWRVIPCGDLGAWQRYTPEGRSAKYADFRLAGPPGDRGCRRIVLDTGALMGRAAGEVRVVARDDEGREVAGRVATPDADHIELRPEAGVCDYVLR